MKNYISGSLRLITAGLLLYTIYIQYQTIENYKKQNQIEYLGNGDIQKSQIIDSLKKMTDSLSTELFIANNAAGRYELSLQHLEQVNPKAAKEFNRFLQNETE